jgi:hypothetical protein
MSDIPPVPPAPNQYGPPPQQRSGCATGIMILVGIVLLLPGLCALVFGGMALTEPHFDSGILSFVFVGLLVGAADVALIVSAIRGPRR